MAQYRLFAVAVVTAGLMTAMQANAATVVVDKVGSHAFADAAGQNSWYVGTSFSVGQETRDNIGAGLFRLNTTDQSGRISDILAFCLQPLEWLRLPADYSTNHGFSGRVIDQLNTLGANAWGEVRDAKTAAAFQMAAWEITTETAGFDINTGHFRITDDRAASNAAEGLAQDWLDRISTGLWRNDGQTFAVLSANDTQDLFTNISPVPLPPAGLLFGLTLGGMALGMRRRTAR